MAFPAPVPAQDPTPEEWEARVEQCQQLHERVLNAVKGGRAAMWAVAEAVYEFNEARGWTALGFETKGQWLAQPEVNLTSSTFDRMVYVWREAVIHREVARSTLSELDVTKVQIVLPAVTSHRASIGEALSDAEVMAAQDLREKYRRPTDPPEPSVSNTAYEASVAASEANGAPDPHAGSNGDSPALTDPEDQLLETLLIEWENAIAEAWTEVDQAVSSGATEPRLPSTTLTVLAFDHRTLVELEAENSELVTRVRASLLEADIHASA